jgi:hypothetical protein
MKGGVTLKPKMVHCTSQAISCKYGNGPPPSKPWLGYAIKLKDERHVH